jgi:hypothetical protein
MAKQYFTICDVRQNKPGLVPDLTPRGYRALLEDRKYGPNEIDQMMQQYASLGENIRFKSCEDFHTYDGPGRDYLIEGLSHKRHLFLLEDNVRLLSASYTYCTGCLEPPHSLPKQSEVSVNMHDVKVKDLYNILRDYIKTQRPITEEETGSKNSEVQIA